MISSPLVLRAQRDGERERERERESKRERVRERKTGGKKEKE